MTFKISNKYYPLAANEDGTVINNETGEVVNTWLHRTGYYYVNIPKNKSYKLTSVHRVVADAWSHNSKPDVKTDVNHIDGNKQNNMPSNLEWCTRKENMRHAFDTGLVKTRSPSCGEDSHWNLHSEEKVREMCKLMQEGMRIVDVARSYNVCPNYLNDIKSGRCWKKVTKDYKFPVLKKRLLSEVTVRWICREIVNGLKTKDIVQKAKNINVTAKNVDNIRYRSCHRSISKEYF